MTREGAGPRAPRLGACLDDLLERAPRCTQPERLCADETVHFYTHDQWLMMRRPPHFVELIDDQAPGPM
jgi:hypothetical protein